MAEGEVAEINLLIKADVQGSAEALRDALTKLSTDEVAGQGGRHRRRRYHRDPTPTWRRRRTPSSSASTCVPTRRPAPRSKENGVDVRYYSVIYEASTTSRRPSAGMLSPEIASRSSAWPRSRKCSARRSSATSPAASWSRATSSATNPIRVLRDNVVIYEGELESLRRFKDDVNEVRAGTECGIGVKNYNDVKVGRPDRGATSASKSRARSTDESIVPCREEFARSERLAQRRSSASWRRCCSAERAKDPRDESAVSHDSTSRSVADLSACARLLQPDGSG